ncbi:MAG: FMN-binding protein [Spirochaetales bacterium]|nr:FMN-binding protein [Spirochaetales bacterium]
MNTEGKIYSIIFTFVLSLFFVAVLAFVFFTLKPTIDINNEFQLDRAILNAMGVSFENNEAAVTLFNEKVEKKKFEDIDYYQYTDADGSRIIAVIQDGDGLWGEIDIVVAINPSQQIVTGFDIIKQNETPGLGGRIDEPWFKAQFKGEKYNAESGISMGDPGIGDTDSSNAQVDAITGASQTSRLVTIIVNAALKKLSQIAGGTT